MIETLGQDAQCNQVFFCRIASVKNLKNKTILGFLWRFSEKSIKSDGKRKLKFNRNVHESATFFQSSWYCKI